MDNIEIFKLFGSIFVDNNEANKSISKTGKEADGLGKKLSNGIKTAGKWALGVGTAAAGVATAAFAATNKITQGFDNINKTATKMGVAAETYQEMDYWAQQNGVSTSSMERAVGRLNQRIGLAADGNDKYAGALQNLGVNFEDVQAGVISTDEAMTTAIQSLSQMENEQQKSAMAADLFGTKLARDLMPALQDGSLSLEDAAEEARKLGKVIGEDTLNAGTEFQDNMTRMNAMISGITQNLFANLIPVFNSFLDWIIQHMPQIQAVFQTVFNVLNTVVSEVISWIGKLLNWLSELFTSNQDTFNGIWQTVQEVFTNVVDFLRESWEFIQAFWKENGEAILENVSTIFTNIWETVEIVFNGVKDIIENILEWAVPFIQEMLQKIYEFWQENGEAIMEALNNVFGWIQSAWQWLFDAVMPIVEFLWNQISTIFNTGLNVILGLVDFFVGLFTGDWERMKGAVVGIVGDLWDGVKDYFSNAWNFIKQPLDNLWKKISGWFTGLKDDAVQWGKNMIDGFVDGIKSIPGKVANAAKGVIDNVAGFLKFWSPAKEGEGRFITEWGANMVDGFLDGVKDETSEAGKVANNLVKTMKPSSYMDIKPIKNKESRSTSEKKTEINISNTFTTKELTPSEIARKEKQQLQRLAMEGWI